MTLSVTQTMTTPSKPGKAPRPVWNVTGPDVDAYADALYALGGRKYRGTFSFFTDPTESVAGFTESDRLSFAERQENAKERAADRADRLHDRSDKHMATADAAHDRARQIMDMIPFGQPVLVDHYSAPRHRRDLAKIGSNMQRSVEEAAYSHDLARRAEHAEREAEGVKRPGYYGNRIKEDSAELRKMERYLARPDCIGEWRERVQARADELTERLAHWRSKLIESGAAAYSKATVAKGDLVLIRGEWQTVAKANPTTVAAQSRHMPWPLKYGYDEIQGHRNGAEEATSTGDAASDTIAAAVDAVVTEDGQLPDIGVLQAALFGAFAEIKERGL